MRWVGSCRRAPGALRMRRDERNFGYSAAHEADPLPLLPSGPGGVHGTSLHRARSSTDRQFMPVFLRHNRYRSLAQRFRARKPMAGEPVNQVGRALVEKVSSTPIADGTGLRDEIPRTAIEQFVLLKSSCTACTTRARHLL